MALGLAGIPVHGQKAWLSCIVGSTGPWPLLPGSAPPWTPVAMAAASCPNCHDAHGLREPGAYEQGLAGEEEEVGDHTLPALSQATVLLPGLTGTSAFNTPHSYQKVGNKPGTDRVPGPAQPLRSPLSPLTQVPGPNPPFSRPHSHPPCSSGPEGFLEQPQAGGYPLTWGIRSLLAPHFPPMAGEEVSSPLL